MINEYLRAPSALFLFIIGLILFIVLLFHIASKIAQEDFDSFDYTVVTILMFITISLSYIIVATAFQAMIYYNIIDVADRLAINIAMAVVYVIILFVPTLLIIHHTFMYFKTRILVVMTFCISIAILLTYFSGVK